MPSPPSSAPPPPPERGATEPRLPARFALQGKLGHGGMASVFLALDTVAGTQVAIKMLHPHLQGDEMVVGRFRREIVAARRITHENVIAIHDLIVSDDTACLVMEYHPGSDLKRLIRRDGAASNERILKLGAQILAGVEAAHAAGVVHRDLKPQNVLVDEHDRVKLTDFGLARVDDLVGLTTHTMTLGTPEYMAPELLSSPVADARADVYSAGVTLFELATGRLPFRAANPMALLKLHDAPAPDPKEWAPHLTAPMVATIRTALAREPEDRFQTITEMRRALLGDGDGGLATTDGAHAPRCARCQAILIPRMTACVECGHEPIVIRAGKGRKRRYRVMVETKKWFRSANDPLNFEQKHDLVQALKELGGEISSTTAKIDRRLRELPFTTAAGLGRKDARKLAKRLEEIGLTVKIRSPFGAMAKTMFSGARPFVVLFTFPMFIVPVLAIGGLSGGTLVFLSILASILIGSSIRSLTPLANFSGAAGTRPTTSPIAVQARAAFSKISSPRLRHIVRRILARGLDLREQSETATDVPAELVARIDQTLAQSLTTAQQIAKLEAEAASIDPAQVHEQIQSLDERIAAARSADETERFIERKRGLLDTLARLDELHTEIVTRTGALLTVTSQLNETSAALARLSAQDADPGSMSVILRDLDAELAAQEDLRRNR